MDDWEAIAIVEMREALAKAVADKTNPPLEPFSLDKFDEMFKGK